MTTASKPAPYRVPLTFAHKKGFILLDQIRTVDKIRLVKKLGALQRQTLGDTLEILQELFSW